MAEENLKEELKKTVEEVVEEKIKPILEDAKKYKETEKLKEVGTEIKSGLRKLWEKFKFWMLIGIGIFLIFLERACRKIHLPKVKTGVVSLPGGVKDILFIEPWFLFGCGIYLAGVIWFFISGFGTKEEKSFSGFLSDILKIVIWSEITIGLGGVFLKWFEGVLPINLNWLIYPIGICWLILGFRVTIEILEGDEMLKISLMMVAVACGLFLVFLCFAQTRSDWNWQVLFTKQNLGFWVALISLFLIWYILKGTYRWTLKMILILSLVLLFLILNAGYKTIKPKPTVVRPKPTVVSRVAVAKPKIRRIVIPRLELGMREFPVIMKPGEKVKLIFYPNYSWIWEEILGYEVFVDGVRYEEVSKNELKKGVVVREFKNSSDKICKIIIKPSKRVIFE